MLVFMSLSYIWGGVGDMVRGKVGELQGDVMRMIHVERIQYNMCVCVCVCV